MKKLLILFIIFIGCKKESPQPPPAKETWTISYSFHCEVVPYYVAIGEITGLHDFSDSIYTKDFNKTIVYDYNTTFRTDINAKAPCYKKTTITYNSDMRYCEDTLYPSLHCERTL